MTKEIKVGDIVRLCGSMLPRLVDDVSEHGLVYAHSMPQDGIGSIAIPAHQLVKMDVIVLKAPNEELKTMMSNRLLWILHEDNVSWRKALSTFRETPIHKRSSIIIVFRSNSSYVIVENPVITSVHEGRKTYVKVQFHKILENVIR